MKKFFLILSSIVIISASNSCRNSELNLTDPLGDKFESINTEDKLQQFLNGAYLNLGYVSAYGTELMVFGDVLSDHLYVTNAKAYSTTYNMNYNGITNDFNFYDSLYDAIMDCNLVINNTIVPDSDNVTRIKAEAKIIRAFAYFTLVNYYSPTPTSGVNQEYGVPLVLGNYDAILEQPRATVAEVYDQIIADLNDGVAGASDIPQNPITQVSDHSMFSKTAAKLLLSRVYLTRRAPGDAELALQYATDIVNNSPSYGFNPINALSGSGSANVYWLYFAGTPETTAENQPETIWELDLNQDNYSVPLNIGANLSLPGLYNRLVTDRRALLFTKGFFDSFPHTDLPPIGVTPQSTSTDVRRGNNIGTTASTMLLTTIQVPTTDPLPGVWTNKYPRLSSSGNFVRNIKVLRFAEAQLNRIEALYLTGQTGQAITELNAFAQSRGGSTYSTTDTGDALRDDILTEKGKEFYGEGQRFLDLKRYGLPLIKDANCVMNCNVPGDSKLFVLPMGQNVLNANTNLTQYPGY